MDKYEKLLNDRFGGALKYGRHKEDGEACALELINAVHDRKWSDNPIDIWDFRPLNDIPLISDKIRTKYLLPVLKAYDGCTNWPFERQNAVISRVIVFTVQRIISALPGLTKETRILCRNASNLEAAGAAARAAGAAHKATWAAARAAGAAAGAAAWAAGWAAWAAAGAAGAAGEAAGETIFINACSIWLEALTIFCKLA